MWLDAWVGRGHGVVSATPPAVGPVSRVAERPHRLCERGVRAACHRRTLEKSNTSVTCLASSERRMVGGGSSHVTYSDEDARHARGHYPGRSLLGRQQRRLDAGVRGGGDPDATVTPHLCIPGEQTSCACAGGSVGAQICQPDGQAYGPCLGCGPTGSSRAASSTSSGTGSTSRSERVGRARAAPAPALARAGAAAPRVVRARAADRSPTRDVRRRTRAHRSA
jgi:hypothetical protein